MHFQALKQSYEDVKSYAAFRSEVAEIRRQLFKEKGALTLTKKLVNCDKVKLLFKKFSRAITKDLINYFI